jgi:3-oxoacyl-[acyl-carrier protein] reductase
MHEVPSKGGEPMGKLTDKVAVVTGASKGIGAGIEKALAAEGAMVVVNYAASRSDADTVVADITAKGGKAYAIQADVSKSEDVERLIADTISTFGRIDVLVNNAGIYRFSPIEAVSEDDFHQHFNINVLGVLLVTKEAIKPLRS